MELIKKEKWHKLSLLDDESNELMIKFFTNNQSYELLIFNLNTIQLFKDMKNAKEIEILLEKLNPSIEAPVEKICQHLKHSLIDSKSNKFTINSHELILESKLSDIKFNWSFELRLLSMKSIKEFVFMPLLMNISEYQARECELMRIIANKDKEIDDFKSQGCKLNRKYLETEVFNRLKFDVNMNNNIQNATMFQKPTECLFNESYEAIHKSCVEKYLNLMNKSVENDQINDSFHEKSEHNLNEEEVATKKNDKSRLKELKQKLVEEETKKQEKSKKKKIF